MNKPSKQRTPLFHIVKRKSLPWYAAWGIRAGAIVLALLVCAVVTTLLTGEIPCRSTAPSSAALLAPRGRSGPFCRTWPSSCASPWR